MNQQKAVKYSGAGNLIIITFEEKRTQSEKLTLAKKLCQSEQADGVLYLQRNKNNGADYEWDFYNSDGSTAEMCGNAARSAGQFCFEELGFSGKKVIFRTLAGIVSCEKRAGNEFEVEMSMARIKNPEVKLTLGEKTEIFFFVDTGVPHLVLEMRENVFDLKNLPLTQKWVKNFRSHKDLMPEGANVTLVDSIGSIKRAVSFERGVENFTAACGTGAVAAALYFDRKTSSGIHKISMPGGILQVDLKTHTQPHLIGPSEKISEIFIEEM